MIDTVEKQLLSWADPSYKLFQCKLMPTVDPDTVIGVRTPILRSYAKKLYRDGKAEVFMRNLPHKNYEENNLHAFLIEQIEDFCCCVEEVDRFLPFVDNWATCDGLKPKCFKKHKQELLPIAKKWLNSNHTYTIRYGMLVLMTHYLDEDFEECHLQWVSEIKSEEYYVNMMSAWYFATALAKQWDYALAYLQQNRLPAWVHNKTIQKAVESYRISEQKKIYLRTLKRKV